MKTTLHTSETRPARDEVTKVLETLSPDPSAYANTYIPAEDICSAITALHRAATLLQRSLHDEVYAGGVRKSREVKTSDWLMGREDDGGFSERGHIGLPDGDPLGDVAEHTID